MQDSGGKGTGKITKRAVDALSMRTGTQAVLWDGEVKGLACGREPEAVRAISCGIDPAVEVGKHRTGR